MAGIRNSRVGNYLTTTIEVREDLKLLCDARKWNRREILENALLAKTTPEDLAYIESIRLEKELEKKRKVLENSKGSVKI